MTIPNDTENRWWVEASGTNAKLVDSFRSTLVTFLAFDKDKVPNLAGTGFVVASAPSFALVITAKHVLTSGVLKIQRKRPGHAPSSLFIHKIDRTPILEQERLKVVRMGQKAAETLNVTYTCYNDSLDIASCIVMPQEEDLITENFSIPLDVSVPEVGEVVHMVSSDGLSVNETMPPINKGGIGQVLTINGKVSIRIGVVTAVYPEGFHHYNWPCFTTSIPAEPRMSGGFVYRPREGITIAACGVVCADNSPYESNMNQSLCGESIIGCTWPALSLRVPYTVPAEPEAPNYTLYEMIQQGSLPEPIGGFENIRITVSDNGDCKIGKVN